MPAEVQTTRMSTKGQLVIPQGIREFTHSKNQTLFTVFAMDKETIVLKKMDTQKILDEFKRIRDGVKNKLTEKEVNEIVHAARKNQGRT